jgi:outer membrane protein assembly factor BamB
VGTAYSAYTFAATGDPAPSFTVASGALPNGLTLNSSTGVLSGTPTAAGSYSFTVQATNGVVPAAVSPNITITVDAAPAITSSASASATATVALNFTVTTTGTPTAAITEAGGLPGGVTFTDNGNGTATIAGPPAAGTEGGYPITINAGNGISPAASQSFTLTVNGAGPSFTADSPGTSTVVGTAYTAYTFAATGDPAPTFAVVSGSLPPGLTLNSATGALSGTPTTAGTYPFTVQAANGVVPAAVSPTITITVDAAPAITSAASASATATVALNFTVTTTGTPTPALSVTSGSLPGGVSFTDNGNGTATIAGPPAALSEGTYPITINATNGIAPDASQSFTLTVSGAAPSFTADSPGTSAVVGTAYTAYTFAATGDPAPTFAVASGSLPPGLMLNSATGVLSGTPTAAASYGFTIEASNGVDPPAVSPTITIIVGADSVAPAITSAASATATATVPLNFTVTTTGTPTPALSVTSGSLPTGVTFTDNGNGTATIAGPPAAGSEGPYPITIDATNGIAPDATQSFTLTVNGAAPSFTADTPATSAVVGTAYNAYTFAATGDPAPTFAVASGSLPPGLMLNSATGVLSGTPTTAGSYSFTVQAANGVVSPAASPTITITVDAAPAITSAPSVSATATVAMNFTVTTTGTPSAAIIESGALPGGVTFTDNGNGTATIAGPPAAGSERSYPITINAGNGISPAATQSFTLTVNGLAPSFTADTPATSAVVGTAYTAYTFAASGDPAPTFSVASGALPNWLTLNSSTGVLSGTPTAAGSISFTVQASNGVNPPAVSPTITITVTNPAPTVSAWALGGAQGTPASTTGVTPGTLVPISSGPPGTMVILTGSGFQAGETVQAVWFNGTTEIKEASFYEFNPAGTASPAGTVTASMFVPDISGNGAHAIGLLGKTSGIQATIPFTVTARLDVGATMAPAGTKLTLNGWGFGVKESVAISANGAPIVSVTTDAKGAFSKVYTLPTGAAAGPYPFSASGKNSLLSAVTAFTVGTPSAGAGPAPSDWSNWGFGPQNDRVNPTETAIGSGNVLSLAPLWTRQVFRPDQVTGAINQANGIAYVGTVHGVVYALNARTGAIVWMYQANGSVYEAPAIANGLVYFSTVNNSQEGPVGNYAYALNAATGALAWSQWLPNGSGWDTPTIVGNQVIMEEANKEATTGGLISLNYLTGAVNWADTTAYGIWAPGTVDPNGTTLYQDTGNPCLPASAPTPGDGCSGFLLAVNLTNGSNNNPTVLDHFPDVSGDDDVPTSPAYDSGTLYIGSKNGSEYSVNAATGGINWSFSTGTGTSFAGDFGIFSSAVVANNTVFFGSGDRLFYALNETTGLPQWPAQQIGGGLIYSSPVLANGVLYIASMSNKTNLAAIDPATGNVLWSYKMTSPAENSPTVSNGILLQGDDAGMLYAFTPGGT